MLRFSYDNFNDGLMKFSADVKKYNKDEYSFDLDISVEKNNEELPTYIDLLISIDGKVFENVRYEPFLPINNEVMFEKITDTDKHIDDLIQSLFSYLVEQNKNK